MKIFLTVIVLFFSKPASAQTEAHAQKFRHLEPGIWMPIWDRSNSERKFQIDTISYDEIPKFLDFRGTVVTALKWTDNLGENILIQTTTGHFNRKEFSDDKTSFSLEDKSELFGYLFRKSRSSTEYVRSWRLYDFNECYGVDWYTGFVPTSTTVTDLDKDGISEITVSYVLICRGGMDPGEMKTIMYEENEKYALRGSTRICIGKESYGGEFKESENLAEKKLFLNFLIQHWKRLGCENGRFN